jgi:hypothetical protein
MPIIGQRRKVVEGIAERYARKVLRAGDTFIVSHISRPDSIGIGCLFDRELYPHGGVWRCGGIGKATHRYYMDRHIFRKFTIPIADEIKWEV